METVDKTLLKAFPTTFSHGSDECGLLLFTHQCKLCSHIQPKYTVYDEYICMCEGCVAGWMIILGKVKRRENRFLFAPIVIPCNDDGNSLCLQGIN